MDSSKDDNELRVGGIKTTATHCSPTLGCIVYVIGDSTFHFPCGARRPRNTSYAECPSIGQMVVGCITYTDNTRVITGIPAKRLVGHPQLLAGGFRGQPANASGVGHIGKEYAG